MGERLKIEWLDKKDRGVLYAKFSLMELARSGEIDFVRVRPSSFDQNLLPRSIKDALSPAQAFLVAYKGDKRCKIVIDTSESYFYMSSAIADSDLYFFSAYNSEIFEKHRFLKPYSWQERYDLAGYKRNFEKIERDFGSYFTRIVRFIPYPVVMDLPARRFSRSTQAVIVTLLIRRFLRKSLPKQGFSIQDPEYRLLRLRYNQLLKYRKNTIRYDVVVRESLWAWPWHRILLYKALENLSGREIYASLKSATADDPEAWWRAGIPEGEMEEVDRMLHKKVDFPESYEEMITSSRLAVFPTGKHWGWRAITFLSMISGGPILMDRPLFEPYFPMNEFKIYYADNEWSNLASTLEKITEEKWIDIRSHNQSVFDKYLAPLPVGRYIFGTIQEWFEGK